MVLLRTLLTYIRHFSCLLSAPLPYRQKQTFALIILARTVKFCDKKDYYESYNVTNKPATTPIIIHPPIKMCIIINIVCMTRIFIRTYFN